MLANAMAEQLGWTRKRFAASRALLQTLGFIELVAPASSNPPQFIILVRGVVDIDH